MVDQTQAPQGGLTPEEQQELQQLQHQHNVDAVNQDAANRDPTSGMPWYQQAVVGAGRGLVHTGRAAANLVGVNHIGDFDTSDEALQREQGIDAPILSRGWGQVGNLVGETAATLPFSGVAGAGAKALAARFAPEAVAAARGALTAGQRLAQGAAEGATQGTLTADPGDRAHQGTFGAVSGMVPTIAGRGLNLLAKGMKRSPEAQALLDKGINLTPPQLNPTGMLARMEETAKDLPVVGGLVEHARQAPNTQFQQKLVQEVAPPHPDGGVIPVKTDGPHAMMNDVQGQYKDQWDQMNQVPLNPTYKVEAPTPPPEPQLSSEGNPLKLPSYPPTSMQDVPTRDALKLELGRATDETAHPMVVGPDRDKVAAQLRNIAKMADNIDDPLTIGDMRGIRSMVKAAKRDAYSSGNPAVGAMWKDADKRITAFMTDVLPPDQAKQFAALDSQYTKYKLVERVMHSAGDRPGGFTPHQLGNAVKTSNSPYDIAGGGGLMRDWSQQMQGVFAQRLPRTGARTIALGTGEAAGLYAAHLAPALAAMGAAGVGAAYGVPAIRSMLQGKGYLNVPFKPLNAVAQAGLNSPIARQLMERYAGQHNVGDAALGIGTRQAQQVGNQFGTDVQPAVDRLKALYQGPVPQQPQPAQEHAKGGKVATVMHEWGQGKLHSGSKKGPVVKSQRQAVAIALSEQRKADRGA